MTELQGASALQSRSFGNPNERESSSKFPGKGFDWPSLGDMPDTETDRVALEKNCYDWSGLSHSCLGEGPQNQMRRLREIQFCNRQRGALAGRGSKVDKNNR